jgi:hypothetical protein
MPATPDDDAFDRGRAAGELASKLAGYDKHFEAINGSVADTAKELRNLVLAVQRLSDQAEANSRTVIATAAALKAADEFRRSAAEQVWSPFQKVLALVAGVGVLVTIIISLKTLLGS